MSDSERWARVAVIAFTISAIASVIAMVLAVVSSAQVVGGPGTVDTTTPLTCDNKNLSYHRHRAKAILRHAYRSEPSRKEIRAYQAHKLCIRHEPTRRKLEHLRKHLKEKMELRQWREKITPYPGPNGTWWAIPAYIVACESGYDYTPSFGLTFGGAYGILVSTWHAYGGGAYASQANYAAPIHQDIVASRIWHDVGPSAWACA